MSCPGAAGACPCMAPSLGDLCPQCASTTPISVAPPESLTCLGCRTRTPDQVRSWSPSSSERELPAFCPVLEPHPPRAKRRPSLLPLPGLSCLEE